MRPGANTWYMALGGVNFARLIVEDYVLGRELPYEEAYRDALYTLVPARVVRDFVFDDGLRERAPRTHPRGEGRVAFRLRARHDRPPFWAHLRSARQHEKFERYLGRRR